ncbi:MAG: DUF502 domain-containing protein [Bacillota bacterium]
MWKKLRNHFIAGVIVLLPVIGTYYVLRVVFSFLNGLTGGIVKNVKFFGYPTPGLGVLLTLAVVLMVGLLANIWLGRRLLSWAESLFLRTPLVRGVYGTIKQIVDAFTKSNQTAFKQVVMVEWPRQGMYTVAFVTGESRRSMTGAAVGAIGVNGAKLINVFVATTPNPTSGFLMLVPEDQVIRTDLSVEEGMKMVISGGVITPPSR